MKKQRRLLSLALALVLCLGLVPTAAMAASATEAIPCKYDEVGDFHDGLAVVGMDGKCGLIDTAGREVVPCIYDKVGEFRDGMAAVLVGGKNGGGRWGFISVDSSAPTAYASTQTVLVDGRSVTFNAYALKDANGFETNYIKLRDVADVLSGTPARFQVGWDGAITITTGAAYTPNGTEIVQNSRATRPTL